MSFPSPRAIAERIACLLALPALAYGIYSSARLAQADAFYRQNTAESLSHAVKMESGNASYHQLYAEHLESAGSDPAPEREAAAILSPLESVYWMDLGVLAEVRGDFPTAERNYLKAASVDRKFAPRWTLMNFYFRRKQPAEFWHWTHEAMPMAFGDASQIFRLCWLMTDDAEEIRRQLPQTDFIRTQYLAFLLSNGHLPAAPPIARDLAERATPPDMNLLLDYCGLAAIRDMASAVEVWNLLSVRRLQHYSSLVPAAGAIVTNGDFRITPIERGFDWHLLPADGALVTLGAAGLSIQLTGNQPQAVPVLTQWIPLTKDRGYRVEYQYDGDADGSPESKQASGIAWEIDDPASGAVLARATDLTPSATEVSGHLDFVAKGLDGATLALTYRRVPGTVRHAEKFTIRKVFSRLQP